MVGLTRSQAKGTATATLPSDPKEDFADVEAFVKGHLLRKS